MLANDYTKLCEAYLTGEALSPIPKNMSYPFVLYFDYQRLNFLVKVLFEDWHLLTESEKIQRVRSIERAMAMHHDKTKLVTNLRKAIIDHHALRHVDWQRALLVSADIAIQHKLFEHEIIYNADVSQHIRFDKARYTYQTTPSSYAIIGSNLLHRLSADEAPLQKRLLPVASMVGRIKNGFNDFVAVYLKIADEVSEADRSTVSKILAKSAHDIFSYLSAFNNYHHLNKNIKALSALVLNDIMSRLPDHLKGLKIDFLFSRSIAYDKQFHILTVSHGDVLLSCYDTHQSTVRTLTSASCFLSDTQQRVAPLYYTEDNLEKSDADKYSDISRMRFMVLPKCIFANLPFNEFQFQDKQTTIINGIAGEEKVTVYGLVEASFDIPEALIDGRYSFTQIILNCLIGNAHTQLEQARLQFVAADDDVARVFGKDLFAVALNPPDTIDDMVINSLHSPSKK